MKSWNYRVVETDCPEARLYGIYEVYYDETGKPVNCTEEPTRLVTEDPEELKWMLLEAFEKPVLKMTDIVPPVKRVGWILVEEQGGESLHGMDAEGVCMGCGRIDAITFSSREAAALMADAVMNLFGVELEPEEL